MARKTKNINTYISFSYIKHLLWYFGWGKQSYGRIYKRYGRFDYQEFIALYMSSHIEYNMR